MIFTNKSIYYVGILVSIISISCVTQAETIHFKTNGDLINKSKIDLSWEHIGFVGDFIEIPDGNHRIRIDAPHNYTLQFTLSVKHKDDLTITETSFYPSTCEPELHVTWPKPVIETSKIHRNVTNIILSNPEFGKPTGRKVCIMHKMMGCTKRKIILTASSEPKGAEIWIDGEMMPFRTDNTLSVPYCEDEDVIQVLVRLPGKINCLESIPLSPDSKVSLACLFNAPGQETAPNNNTIQPTAKSSATDG